MFIFMILVVILMGFLVVYWNWIWGVMVVIILGIGFYVFMKIEDLKKVYKMDNYDRIVVFMNGKDLSEV